MNNFAFLPIPKMMATKSEKLLLSDLIIPYILILVNHTEIVLSVFAKQGYFMICLIANISVHKFP